MQDISITREVFTQTLARVVCSPIQRIQVAQQTRTVQGNAFHVLIKIVTTKKTDDSTSSLSSSTNNSTSTTVASEKKVINGLALYRGLDASLLNAWAKVLGKRLCSAIVPNNNFLGHVISPLLSLPFSTVYVKLVSDPSMTNDNVFTGLKKVFNEEGLLGLYRGFLLQVIGNEIHSVFYLIIHSALAPLLKRKSLATGSSFTDELICGTLTTILTSLITYPLLTVTRRIQAQKKSEQQSVPETVKAIKSEGLRRFYSGFAASMTYSILCTPVSFVGDIIYGTLMRK
ncbi:predicted protein [Naegleria gruberi]|uniref:Predicted protein n=1 Tax=Naegleria gruberi TaxID=5762 RepID=D2V8U4_NAEGR|nr:uncharacterized protein NAEGRDRAFT_65284 [Naegleria gruberi]EFC46860.1 predicted protein [Naegleria gruberi]|eukprot:XP_002679604.1 predicted protein [Naegleria gruberi strain NEG-M]